MTFAPFREALQTDLLARMPDHLARLGWSRCQIESYQRASLRALLGDAVERSPFHRERLPGIDVERFELEDLSSLPVMTKAEMMARLGDVFTDRRLTPAMIEAALAATTSQPAPILDRYIALSSGGSSGQRGVFVVDREALAQFVATLTRPLMARLRASGGPPPGGLRIAMIAAASAVHATGCASPLTAGERLPFRFLPVPVEGLTREFAEGATPVDVCARTIRELTAVGAKHFYVSNLPLSRAQQTLTAIMDKVRN